MKPHILLDHFMSFEIQEIHRKSCQSILNGGMLLDHLTSLRHGLQLIRLFFYNSQKENTILHILKLVCHVKQKLYSLSDLSNDESLVVKLDCEYSDLREEMKNVIINLRTNKYQVIFPGKFSCHAYKETSLLLCRIIEELLSSDCKADQIRPVIEELKDIRKILSLLEPFFDYEKHARNFRYDDPWDKPFGDHEKEKKILSIVAAVMERVTCFVYLSAVGKMDDPMVISLKNIASHLNVDETQIMNMYLSLDVDSTENLKSHISMSLRLLGWNKRCYLGTEHGEALKEHFTSIKHGLVNLVIILSVSENEDLKLRVVHLIDNVKKKLYSLPHTQNDENLEVNLEHAYCELREEMKNVVINPGTNDLDTLFPKVLESNECLLLEEVTESTSLKLTSSSKANQIAQIMKETMELRKKLRSLKPLFDYARIKFHSFFGFTPESEVIKVNVALTAFLDRATCLLYLSLVAKLTEDMLVSLKKNFSLLIEETEMKKISIDSGIIFKDDFDSDIDISLSLMERHQVYHIYTLNEAMLEDHFISLKHGIEFLKWYFNIYNFDEDFKRCIILLAGNVKQKLELLTYNQEDESLNMDVNCACAVLREEMKNVIIGQRADEYESRFPEENFYDSPLEKIMKAYLTKNYVFLVEKIATLVTSNCKTDRIAPLAKELQVLRKRLLFFKPLGLYICGIPRWRDEKRILKTFLTFLYKATFLIYLTFVGTMDKEMVLLVKSRISIAIKETDDVQEICTLIFNQFLSEDHYKVKEFYLLENLMILLENNDEFLEDETCKLHEVLKDIHSFLLALPPNVILIKLHLLKESFEDILCHSIPVVYACYLELTEVDISAEFNCVLNLIKHIKSEAIEMKVYYFPRVDDLGFLEFILGYLEDLMKNQEVLLKEEIAALYVEVNTLLSLAKSRTQEELAKNPWNDIMNLAYQAEYIIDLYIVSSPRDLVLVSSLSKIIQQLHNIRAEVAWEFSHLCKSLPAQDVAGETTKPQVISLTTQDRDSDAIVGLQEETKIIMEDLLNGEDQLNVVAIVGMAGVGKTTLALTLYDTPSMAHHFDIRAWCAVSQSYQFRALLVSILVQVNASDKVSNMDDQDLADHFCRSLKQRRYLIILDDVWDTTLWKDLKHYLPDDSNGSRIVITTRNWEVANKLESKVNELHGLSDDNSWQLFRQKTLQIESLSDDLLAISKGIIKNCEGLPLSIVIVAGILSGTERTEEKWNLIARNVSSSILSDPQGGCEAILKLSYNQLPNHLRLCFLYLGSFPEDEEISVNRLILLWIGEGFVQDTKIYTAEELAKKYVDDLILKNLVIPVKKRSGGGVKTFRLHDLLRDFCLGKAKEKHFFTLFGDEIFVYNGPFKINRPLALQDPRRIIINGSYYMPREMVDFSCHSVQTMICHGLLDPFEIKKRIGSRNMVLLRVLEVDEVFSLDEVFLVDDGLLDISNLVQLRYLAFHSRFKRDSLSTSSISKLQNLEILILKLGDFKVTDFIWDMQKLRHVRIHEASFEVDCNKLQNSSVLLENLKSLSVARVSYGDSRWLSKLSGLQRLHCLFTVDDLEVDSDVKENQMLTFNGALVSLKVANQTGRVQRFISTCQLPKNLRKLTMSSFYLQSNDISMIGQTLAHLEVFKIYGCGVPSGYQWDVNDEDFPELKVLKLKDLKICKWTVSEDSFPNLEQLWVTKCDCLDEIPLEFGSLMKLRVISVEECPPYVYSSARKIEKVQHEDQNTEMRVHISRKFIPMY